MPPSHHYSTSQSYSNPSLSRPSSSLAHNHNNHPAYSSQSQSQSSTSMSATKTRQYAHLHSQLAQLNAHLADTENLLRMTAVQAEDMRFLGGYVGGLFMGAAKVLGEEGVKAQAQAQAQTQVRTEGNDKEKEREKEERGAETEEEL
ncbi:DASH complex subunit Hsk3 like-domain-containing protein [Aspergillus karnatakaensis]|uniref:DASH complex subunit HSK3 family protein n=1 Tax=Aspergillus karnatakaensis TaxID=1810916 RepID=UPI003CCD2182